MLISVFLSSYRNIPKSLGECEKIVETLALQLAFPQHFSFIQTFAHGSIKQLDYKHKISIAW